MKRFITVAMRHGEEVLIIIRNSAATTFGAMAMTDAYTSVKNHLQKKQIAHNDQNANHHSELPHQGGYVSFYIAPDGKWMQVEH